MKEADDGGFLSRWARRKARVRGGVAEAVERPIENAAQPAEIVAATAAPALVEAPLPVPGPVPEPTALPTMEDVARLTRSSDYSPFVRPGVEDGVRNAALKKLFSDPHFNVMDGLDTYIDDYGKPDPIPIAMLRQMNQAKFLGLFDDEENDENKAAASAASTDGGHPPAVAQSLPLDDSAPLACAPEARPDDDPDLRLQQDDGVERPGPAPGPRA